MSNVKRIEKAQRTLTDREVSDLRALHSAGSARQILARVERIVADRSASR